MITWYVTRALTSKVKCQSYNVTSSVWCMFAVHNSTAKSRRSDKIGRKVASVIRVTFGNSLEVRRSKVKVAKPHNAVTENQQSLRNGKAFKFGTRMEKIDPHRRRGRWPPSWKLWVSVQVTTCWGRGRIVATPLQAQQLAVTNLFLSICRTVKSAIFDNRVLYCTEIEAMFYRS